MESGGDEIPQDTTVVKWEGKPGVAPVTVACLLTCDPEGIAVGEDRFKIFKLCGIAYDVEVSCTARKYRLSDDTGSVVCMDWIQTLSGPLPVRPVDIRSNIYVEVYGLVKVIPGGDEKQLWTLASRAVGDFDEATAHMAEVLCFDQHRKKLESELDGIVAVAGPTVP